MLKVREIKFTDDISQYYIEELNVYLNYNSLLIVCEELNLDYEIIDTSYHEGYLGNEFKKANVLKDKYDITQ